MHADDDEAEAQVDMMQTGEVAAALIRQEAEGGTLLTAALLSCMAHGEHISQTATI